MKEIDVALFYWINGTWRNAFLDRAMPVLTNIGAVELAVGIIAALIFLKPRDAGFFIVFLCGTLVVSSVMIDTLKSVLPCPRPAALLTDARLLVNSAGFSFPSAHAAAIFTGTAFVCAYFKRFFVLYAAAVMVALSRVYLGVHYPSDVLGGACAGYLLGLWGAGMARTALSKPQWSVRAWL